jgi:hypothetical protein
MKRMPSYVDTSDEAWTERPYQTTKVESRGSVITCQEGAHQAQYIGRHDRSPTDVLQTRRHNSQTHDPAPSGPCLSDDPKDPHQLYRNDQVSDPTNKRSHKIVTENGRNHLLNKKLLSISAC